MAEKLIIGFLLHLIGDYVLQNDWMATHKSKSDLACAVHVLVYSAPFFFLVDHYSGWLIILFSHFLIDRYRLAYYWVSSPWYAGKTEKPAYISVWVMIIVDNTFHLLFNSIAIFLSAYQ
jgi:hypothetical protein